jgi:signal transduction histidine kinase
LLAEQEEKNKMELTYKDELLYANIQATEKERARIARDLHDEVGASLSLLRMQLTHADAKPIIDNTIDTVRRISYDLLPPTLEAFGLVTALQAFCEKIKSGTGVNVNLDAFEEQFRFDAVLELSVYRILQELVNNTLKHADAHAIDIDMKYSNNTLCITYHDDGKGYDYVQWQKEGGLGLKNIELRTKQCKGALQYQTLDDKTVLLTITIPLTTIA